MGHTKGDWKVRIVQRSKSNRPDYICIIEGEKSKTIAQICTSYPEYEANAERIVSCVNALQGLNPEAVKPMYEACKSIWEGYCKYNLDYGISLLAAISKLDTLLAKIKGVDKSH